MIKIILDIIIIPIIFPYTNIFIVFIFSCPIWKIKNQLWNVNQKFIFTNINYIRMKFSTCGQKKFYWDTQIFVISLYKSDNEKLKPKMDRSSSVHWQQAALYPSRPRMSFLQCKGAAWLRREATPPMSSASGQLR